VDASVGAKNGCNFCGSKNRLGTYVPPVAALLDSSFFETQDEQEVSNALAEMIKMAIMKSPELFQLLRDNGPRLVENRFAASDNTDEVPARVLQLSIQTMLEELTPNLWEDSLDRLVDFGHAIGQDLEMQALGTEHYLMHGEAVAVDMAYMSVLSNVLGLISSEDRDAMLSTLRTCQLPVYNPVLTQEFLTWAIGERVKNSMGQKLPLPIGIGKARIVNNVSDADLQKAFVLWQKLCSPSDKASTQPGSSAQEIHELAGKFSVEVEKRSASSPSSSLVSSRASSRAPSSEPVRGSDLV
jgi:3-dehydroquinate synthase